MLSRRTIEAYLFFLLRHRLAVSVVIAVLTFGLALSAYNWMHVFPNFFDLYPPGHPYIKLYQQYRSMFGTANTVLIVVETKNGTIFDDPGTVQKVDRITLALLHDIPGVNGEQVFSITHPKIKTTLTAGSGIKVVPLMYPRVPENKDDLEFLKLKVYTTEGVHGFFVSDDDKATQIVAGFWEEYFDLWTMWAKIQEIVAKEKDENTNIYVTGPPILFAYFVEIMPKMVGVLAASIVMILLILWIEFRSWQGVVIPAFSGALSAVWGLGFGGLCGINLDPLVLVIPLLISARAHSHSVQSMERYHEEYHRLRDKDEAIVKSYTEIYAPAMVSLLADGCAILTLLVARIPIIQKLAILCSFWIISIFVSVVTLHPIILSFMPPPEENESHSGALERFMSWMVIVATTWLFYLYAYVPLWPVQALLGVTVAGGLADALFGVALPGYAQLGRIVSALVDAIGAVFGRLYVVTERLLIWMSIGWRRGAMAAFLLVLLAFGLYFQHQLKVGDTTPGAALLYADHPYNRAFAKVNEKFTGASQLVIIAEGRSYCTVGGKPCEGEACQLCFPEDEAEAHRGGTIGLLRQTLPAPLQRLAGIAVRPPVCGTEQCLQREGAVKDAETLNNLDLFARYMSERQEVGGTVTAGTLLKKIFRTFHEGDPKWELLPTRNDHVSQLFFLLTASARRGEYDRFFDANYTNATIQVFYKDYTHETIENSIARAKQYILEHGRSVTVPLTRDATDASLGLTVETLTEPVADRFGLDRDLEGVVAVEVAPDGPAAQAGVHRGDVVLEANGQRVKDADTYRHAVAAAATQQQSLPLLVQSRENVRYRLAGGLIGILAGVNEEVEWSYRVNLALILLVVFVLSYLTYVSVVGALIVMLPSLVAQPLSEAVMYLFGIDMNINSLPVAAVGIGIGIDYGYYVLSRIVEELCAGEGFDMAIRRTFETTGKTVMLTGVSLTASIIFWVFFPMKFQADMALLLVLLLGFHLMGALMFIPPMVSLFRPRFAIKYAEERLRVRAEAQAAAEAEAARSAAIRVAGP